MKLVYTNENRFLVNNARNLVENSGIEVLLKNEHFVHGIRPYDDWLELWVINDGDYEAALKIVEAAFSSEAEHPWFCPECGEKNEASFEVCWQCQRDRPEQA